MGDCAAQGFSAWEGEGDPEENFDPDGLEGFDDEVGEQPEPEGTAEQSEGSRREGRADPQTASSKEDDIDTLLQAWQTGR